MEIARAEFAAPRTREKVRIRVIGPGRQIKVTVDGDAGALEGMRTLVALGAPAPTWLPVANAAEAVLSRCPEAPVEEVLRFLTASQAKRSAVAKDEASVPVRWQAWALTLDPVRPVRTAWVKRFPEDEEFEPMALTLAEDPEVEVRRQTVKRVWWSEAVFARAAADPEPLVATQVAASDYAPERALLALAAHPVERVRAAITRRERVPVAVLRVLAKDPSPTVRGAVAGHRDTPASIWRRLKKDPDGDVRYEAVGRGYRESSRAKAFAAKEQAWRAARVGG